MNEILTDRKDLKGALDILEIEMKQELVQPEQVELQGIKVIGTEQVFSIDSSSQLELNFCRITLKVWYFQHWVHYLWC